MVWAKLNQKIRRTGQSLFALFLALIAAGFLTAGGWQLLAEWQGPGPASVIVGALYAVLAAGVTFMRTQKVPDPEPEVDRIAIGLALSSTFLQGFFSGREFRR